MLEENKFKRTVRNIISTVLAVLLIFSGAIKRAKRASQQKDSILSIFFHNPPAPLFKKCIIWLQKNGYCFISTQQVIDFIYSKKSLPPNPVWITFDDGWSSNLQNVLPVMREYNVPVTFFIPSAEIEKGAFWFCQAIKYKKDLPPEFHTDPFNKLLELKNNDRQSLVNKLYPARNNSYSSTDTMTVEQIKEIAAMRQVTIGSHTVNHVVTVHCSLDELAFELRESKNKLEAWTGTPVLSFAYPNGDYDGREKELLLKNGYLLAATIKEGLITPNTDPWFVPRNCVLDDGSFAENLCHLMGVWTPFINKLKKMAGR